MNKKDKVIKAELLGDPLKPSQNLKRVYLAQFSIIVEEQFVLLPYSAATVWAYAQSFREIQENYKLASDFLFIKRPISEIMEKIENPDVFGFSTYVWNSNYTDTLARRIKEKYPDCLIVYGGPQIPDKDEQLFFKKPWIDICVHHEGEFTFKEILLENLEGKKWANIGGLSYNDNGKRTTTGPSIRIRDLNALRSPYLDGMFDGYVEKNPDYTLNAILETNRGCPYKCTFCDWGSSTFSKLTKFDFSRISDELKWMGKNKIDCVVNADANFGILRKKDSEIVDKLIETKKEYSYPKLFTTNWAKNNNELAIEMATRLNKAGLLRKFAIALQSLEEIVLQNIERTNMKLNNFDHLVNLAKKNNITVMIELIMTLPGETYEGWIKNYCKLLKYENLYIESYPLSVLANSEMNSPKYKEEHGLQTTRVKLPFNDYVDEYEQMVLSTKTMSWKEVSQAWIFTWLVRSMHSFGFLFYVCNFIVKEFQISYYQFYKTIEEEIQKSRGLIKSIYKKQKKLINEEKFSEFYLTNWWIDSVGKQNRKQFYKEMEEIVERKFAHPLLSEVFNFQDIACYNPNENYPIQKKFSYNFNAGKQESCIMEFEHGGIDNHKSYKSYISLNRSGRWKAKFKTISVNNK